MNNIAVIPYICMHALQIQNVQRNVNKKASIKELNNKINPLEIKKEFDQTTINIENEHFNKIIETNINNNSLPNPITDEINLGSIIE